ncbi:DUF599 domain-containing protein [Pseudooceanicola sp. C21-150M6]|uniref:DUF599 domain-containing protein n=1 Tax=Pseudooceanicola sp. C21-150M6 TaxID=3434355 RepID=UPI003D7F57F2
MTWSERISLFSPLDLIAVALLYLTWVMIGYLVENPPRRYPSVSNLMADYRREWMRQMVTRSPRIFDSQILATLRQGTSFFASASMIVIGAGLAAIGNAEQLVGRVNQITLESDPVFVLEIKLLVALSFVVNAFLKFVWSHRLFGYCAILMAAVPNHASDPAADPRAAKAATINVTAARAYNRGLRSVYFAIGAIAWLLGDWALLPAVLVTSIVLLRREFASQSRAALMDPSDRTMS